MKLADITQEELLGRKLADLVAPGRRELLEEALDATILPASRSITSSFQSCLDAEAVGQFAINLSPMRDENPATSLRLSW